MNSLIESSKLLLSAFAAETVKEGLITKSTLDALIGLKKLCEQSETFRNELIAAITKDTATDFDLYHSIDTSIELLKKRLNG